MLDISRPSGVIKSVPEHFIVREIAQGRILQPVQQTRTRKPAGRYTKFLLTKRNMPAELAYNEIARQLAVERSAITSYGQKDAVALTAQLIVIEGEYQSTFNHDRIWLQQLGKAPFPLKNGQQDGNHFSIHVCSSANSAPKADRFLNLFGPQRFGDGRIGVGRMLLEGDFEQAADLLFDSMNGSALKNAMDRHGISAVDAMLTDDFAHARAWKILQWQSHLWNHVAKGSDERYLPMWQPETADYYYDLWAPNSVDAEMLEHTHQFTRDVWAQVKDHHVYKKNNGFLHQFSIRSGAYATQFLDTLYDCTDASREKYK